MEDHISRLFDLIASKTFNELNEEESAFVLSHMTEEEYILQRRIVASSSELEYNDVEPHALILSTNKAAFLSKRVPLYQVFLGAACLLAGFFVFNNRKSSTVNFSFIEDPIEISLIDSPATYQVVHDTIVEYLPGMNSPIAVIRDTVTLVQTVFVNRPETRMLEAGAATYNSTIDKRLLESKSLSLQEDKSSQLLPKIDDDFSMK